MKILNRDAKSVCFDGEDGSYVTVYHTNRGEPFKEGLEFEVFDAEQDLSVTVFLTEYELFSLRNYLNKLTNYEGSKNG